MVIIAVNEAYRAAGVEANVSELWRRGVCCGEVVEWCNCGVNWRCGSGRVWKSFCSTWNIWGARRGFEG